MLLTGIIQPSSVCECQCYGENYKLTHFKGLKKGPRRAAIFVPERTTVPYQGRS